MGEAGPAGASHAGGGGGVRRPQVAVVMSSWGVSSGEHAAAVRLIAGAVAMPADVAIVSLDDRSNPATRPPEVREDGIFTVYSVSAGPSQSRLVDVLATALEYPAVGRASARAAVLPEIASRRLLAIGAEPSGEAPAVLERLAPDVIVLAGVETLWLSEALPVGPSRARVVVLPLLGNDARLDSPGLTPLPEMADAIGAMSEVEHDRLQVSVGRRDASIVRRLRLCFPVNQQAARSGLAGMASFGRYVLLISGWPPDDHPPGAASAASSASTRAPAHDYLRAVAGDVSVVEVRHGRWRVSEAGRHHEFPWVPSRMNLWRLMGGAVATLDVRRQGPVGREAVESLSLGTPVIVPAGSVAAEHAERSNGGLWWRRPGEMLDEVRFFLERPAERDAFGESGRAWAEREHGDMERSVDEIVRLVLGQP
jgi:hypothetical protein